MDHGADDSYIIIVNNSDGDPGIQIYNFENDAETEEKETLVNEFQKIFTDFTSENNDQISNVNVEGDPLEFDIKQEPSDYEEFIPDLDDLSTTCEFSIENNYNSDKSADLDISEVKKSKKKNCRKFKRGIPTNKRNSLVSYSELNEDTKRLVDQYVELLQNQIQQRPPIPPNAYKIIDGVFVCSYCDETQSKLHAADRHYRFRHGERYFKCVACDATFRRGDILKQHENFCQGENINLVKLARAIYKEQKLNRPRSEITKKMKLPCAECGTLIRRSNMKAHVKRHFQSPDALKRVFKCLECSVEYVSARSLDAHINTHRGLKPYLCKVCNKPFSNKNTLLTHKWVHFEKRFECNYCSRKYRKKMHLIRHIQETHEDKENILCTKCGVNMLRSKWPMHVSRCGSKYEKSSELNIYKCIDCQKAFKTITYLNGHMKRAHGKKILTREKFLEILPQITMKSELQFDLVKIEDIEQVPLQIEDFCDDMPDLESF